MAAYTPQIERDIALGQRAAQSGIRELLDSHESKVLNRMVAQYRSKEGLSPADALLGVGIISELRSLTGAVNRAVEAGAVAGRKLTS